MFKNVLGKAQIHGVEFHKTAQRGFSESHDPRFGLAFVSAKSGVSKVSHCSFTDSYATAFGVFETDGVDFSKNVIVNTWKRCKYSFYILLIISTVVDGSLMVLKTCFMYMLYACTACIEL